MLVFLVRHAHSDPGEPDSLRPLSARGMDEARSVATRLAEHASPPALVLTSPLLRARQTADAIAEATDTEVRVEELLSPGATAESLQKAVEGASGPVACIGHQPDCSEIARDLTGRDPGFPPGGVAELELDA